VNVKQKVNKYNVMFMSECFLFFILSLFLVPEYDDLIFKYNFIYEDFSSFLHQVLYYGNGRLLGNAAALFFSRHMLLFRVFESVFVSMFCLLSEKLTELKNSKLFIFAAITVLPLWQFIELFPWMSAFINYFVPLVLFLLTLFIIKKNVCAKNKVYFAVLFLLGVCEQLFVEHNAIIYTVFAAFLLLHFIKIKSVHSTEAAVLLISNLLGAVILFGYRLYADYSKTYVFRILPHYRSNILYAVEQNGISGGILFMVQNIKYFVFTLVLCGLLIGALLAAMLYIERHAG